MDTYAGALLEAIVAVREITGSSDVNLHAACSGAMTVSALRPDRCRRPVLAATSAGALMVPGRPSAMVKLLSPRRYRDPDYLQEIGGELYGGAYRRDPGLLRTHGEQIRPPAASAMPTSSSRRGAGRARSGCVRCRSRRW